MTCSEQTKQIVLSELLKNFVLEVSNIRDRKDRVKKSENMTMLPQT